MNKKYICFSGYVKSKSDGDTHYIQASRVAELYRVNVNECILINSPSDLETKTRGYTKEMMDSLTALHPQNNGDYTL